jgi:hypothetical protein
MRLIQHTAAYWLLWAVRQAIPDSSPLAQAEFATLQGYLFARPLSEQQLMCYMLGPDCRTA